MTNETWRTDIYEPYLETWKILKLIQFADQTDNYEEQWQRYVHEIDRLSKTYPGNKFVEELITLLVNAGDTIARINNKDGGTT